MEDQKLTNKIKFIIFAHPRSGSTNLSIVLQQHPEIRIADEPFHKNYQKWHPEEKCYINYIHDTKSLDLQLNELFTSYNGLKILEYQLPVDLNGHILLDPEIKVIFLYRKNLLKAVISDIIARQSNIWHRTFNSELKPEDFGKLEAVNIEALRNRIGVLHGMLGRYLSILQQRQSDTFFTLSYEDLYTDNVNRNRKKVAEVFNFLGLDIPETKKIYVILNPEKGKINSAETYRLIPNIYEVEAAIGSDQTGWLFR